MAIAENKINHEDHPSFHRFPGEDLLSELPSALPGLFLPLPASVQDVEGERYLVDLKSTHGTFLESKRLKAHEPVKWPEGRTVFGLSTERFSDR